MGTNGGLIVTRAILRRPGGLLRMTLCEYDEEESTVVWTK